MSIKWRQRFKSKKRLKFQKQQQSTKFNENTKTTTEPLKQMLNIAENHNHCPLVKSDNNRNNISNNKENSPPSKSCHSTNVQQRDCNQRTCEEHHARAQEQRCKLDVSKDSTYAPCRLAGLASFNASARKNAAAIIERATSTKLQSDATLTHNTGSIQPKTTTIDCTIPETKASAALMTSAMRVLALAVDADTAAVTATKPATGSGSHLKWPQPSCLPTLNSGLFAQFRLPSMPATTAATMKVSSTASARSINAGATTTTATAILNNTNQPTSARALVPLLALCFLCIASAATTTAATATSSTFNTTTARTANAPSDATSLPLAPVVAAVMATATSKPGASGAQQQCSLSEFTCANTRCVPLSKYCNNVNDCGDGSDEPRFCTRCNRTYYGDIGLTYSLELYRPKQDRLPYVCVLTFTAAGGQHGDVVQVTLDSFTIGRFTSYLHDGCPDGYMQIAESARTPIGGMWCGTSWGPVLFYSETRSLIFTIKLNKLARDQSGYNFDFRIRYKVLSKDSSVTRYGGIKLEELRQWYNRSSFQNQNAIEDFTNSSGAHSDRYGQDFSLFSAYANNKTFMSSLQPAVEKDALNYTEPKYYLGDLIPGTYCSRIFSDCDRKACRLQSPNFPGIYPRNLTCYYAVRQHEVPHGKHAMILVRQTKGNLVWISTQDTGIGSKPPPSTSEKDKKFEPRLKTWSECDNVQDLLRPKWKSTDYVTVYDGYTTRDPVVLKFCGGGQAVPAAVSSGPELLVEFTTSPFGTFTGTSSQVLPLYGFQLDVEVIFVDVMSPTYSKNKKPCEFWIRGAGRGILESPKHSLAPNTTCLYHLQGMGVFKTFDHLSLSRRTSAQGMNQPLSRFKVWISMMKFNLDPDFGQMDETSVGAIGVLQTQEDCSGMLRIWDGALREPPACKDLNCASDVPSHPLLSHYSHNSTNVIARYCRGTVPRTCDRSNINETYARPCTISESYVSSSDSITLELKNTESTVLRPLDFKLKYEFIDLHQDGLPLAGGENDCNRKFVSSLMDRKDPAIFRSVRNIFLFGRGGTRNLKCIYKFEGQRGERIRIKLRKVTTLNRPCMSRVDEDINRSFCYGDTNARIEIFERPYHDSILLPRGCLCNSSNSSHLPVEYTSTGRDLEVHFTAINMTTLDDPDAINFEGMFEFIKGPASCKDGRRKFGPSGTIHMTFGDMECRTRPWLIEPSNGNKFLYVRLKAIFLRKYNPKKAMNTTIVGPSSYRCETKARVVLTTSEGLTITACPLSPDSKAYEFVEIFSSGWNERPIYSIANRSKAISVEYLRPENGDFTFNWMELVPRPVLSIAEDCQYKCSELGACVNASVWCDGIIHCPSGDDETFLQCSAIMKLPTEILATLCLIIVLLCCAFAAFAYKRFAFHCRKIKRKFRGSSVLQTRLKSLSSMDTAVLEEKEVIC